MTTTLKDVLHAPIKSEGQKRKKQIHKIHRVMTNDVYCTYRQYFLHRRNPLLRKIDTAPYEETQ